MSTLASWYATPFQTRGVLMYCPRCNSQIQAEDTNLGTLVARCQKCQEVFRFADQLEPLADSASGAAAARPENVVIEDRVYGYARRIRWRWNSSLLLSAVVVVLICGGWFAILLTRKAQSDLDHLVGDVGSAGDFQHVFLYALVAFGFVGSYCGLASILNSTTIEMDAGMLTLRRGPLPWPGNRSFPLADIRDIRFEKEYEWRNGEQICHFAVNAVDRENARHTLLRTLASPDSALYRYVTQQLQEWLSEERSPRPDTTHSSQSEAVWRPT